MYERKYTYRNFQLIPLFFLCIFTFKINAQKARVIDNKGTLINFNNNRVFDQKNNPNPNPPTPPISVERDIWLNRTTNIPEVWHNGDWIELISKELAFPTKEISAPLTTVLTNKDYKVVINAIPNDSYGDPVSPMIKLPAASSSNKGKVYIIKNATSSDTETDISYRDNEDKNTKDIKANTMIVLQSDGTEWQQIN